MKTKASLIFAATAMLVGTPALAASDYLLKLDGVDGEASATIEVASWSFGVCNAGQCSTVKSPRGAASGKVKHVPTKITNASQNTQSLREAPTTQLTATANVAAEPTPDAAHKPPREMHWDLATGKGARSAGGVTVATGDVDGDGHADLAYAGTQGEVSAFTLTYDKASPVLAKLCMGKHFSNATLFRGTESYTLTHATVSCTGTGPVSMTFTGGQMKHTKTGHVTLLK